LSCLANRGPQLSVRMGDEHSDVACKQADTVERVCERLHGALQEELSAMTKFLESRHKDMADKLEHHVREELQINVSESCVSSVDAGQHTVRPWGVMPSVNEGTAFSAMQSTTRSGQCQHEVLDPSSPENCPSSPEDCRSQPFSRSSSALQPSASFKQPSSDPIEQKTDRANQCKDSKTSKASVLTSVTTLYDLQPGEFDLDTRWGRYCSFVESATFEMVFALLIFINALVIALEVQYDGLESCYMLQIPGCSVPMAERWPGVKKTLQILDWTFGVIFTLEIIVKVTVQQRRYFLITWNILDLIVMSLWYVGHSESTNLSVDPLVLRLARLGRIMRSLKLVKAISAFDSLYLIVGSIKASISVLYWSTLMLFTIGLLIGLVLNQLVQGYIRDPSLNKTDRILVFKYFGTFSRCMISMLEITIGNWVPICRTLVDLVNEWFGLFFLVYQCVVGFAVVKVVTGVFLHETFKVANSDDSIMTITKQRQVETHIAKMEHLFHEADHNDDGFIVMKEFRRVLKDPSTKNWLAAQGLEVRDVEKVFEILHGGDKKIDVRELVEGVSMLKGQARALDMYMLSKAMTSLQASMDELQNRINCTPPPVTLETRARRVMFM